MPTLYPKPTRTPSTAEMVEAIIASSPMLSNAGLPFVGMQSDDDLRKLGEFFYTNIDLSNQYISSLLNTVAISTLQSKYWSDPWYNLEKGKIVTGELIEEVFIKMSKPHHYDIKRAEKEVFKRDLPDVMTAFHGMNYQYFYKKTIQARDLMQAFHSMDAMNRFITDIIDSMFTSANYDSYQVKKYLIARAILAGFIGIKITPNIVDENTGRLATGIARGTSSLMKILSPNYNYFRVPNYSDYSDQVIIMNAMTEGFLDASVLAASFNMDKAEFLAMHRLITSGFGDLDNARLAELFEEDSTYIPLTVAESEALDKIPFAIFDRNWFQIYDYYNGVTNIYNNDGLYWNYDLHTWKAIGCSPFANAVAFNSETPEVTGISISPATVAITKGQSVKLAAVVTTTGFASQMVTWVSDTPGVTVSPAGIVTVSGNVTATSATITATSIASPDITDSITITIV